mgnify:CR=1 FL=1
MNQRFVWWFNWTNSWSSFNCFPFTSVLLNSLNSMNLRYSSWTTFSCCSTLISIMFLMMSLMFMLLLVFVVLLSMMLLITILLMFDLLSHYFQNRQLDKSLLFMKSDCFDFLHQRDLDQRSLVLFNSSNSLLMLND